MKKIKNTQNKFAFPLVANHFKRLTFLFVLLCSTALLAQKPSLKVGDNPATIHSSAALDAESTNKGFLTPRMTTAQRDAIDSPAKGLVLYNISLDCLQVNKGTTVAPTWECIGASAAPSATVDCNTAGFVGSYLSGVALSGQTYTVTVTNSSFAAIALTNNTSDLTITGVSGVTVLSVSPATLNLASAASGTITYTLQGTPAACGTLQGVWTKLSLTCTKTKTVAPNVNCATASWTAAVSPAVSAGLTNNTAYTGTYSIPYTGGGCTLAADSITQSGLTLAFGGGTIAASGNLVYTLSGTYTGTTGGVASFTTSGGCSVVIGMARSCMEIKTANALAADGVYTIDPDGAGSVFGAMQAQCDMTTDGGGWTLVLNYVKAANTDPSKNVRATLPIIGSSTLGTNEANNSLYWGHVGLNMLGQLPFTQFRFFGITNAHSRRMHFKTTSGVTLLRTGSGPNFLNTKTNFTPFPDHTTLLPATMTNSNSGYDNNALTDHTFFKWDFETWTIGSSRWDMDNAFAGNTYHNIYRVWVK
jgi:hypothetical protein